MGHEDRFLPRKLKVDCGSIAPQVPDQHCVDRRLPFRNHAPQTLQRYTWRSRRQRVAATTLHAWSSHGTGTNRCVRRLPDGRKRNYQDPVRAATR
jgi:hypothetical protein